MKRLPIVTSSRFLIRNYTVPPSISLDPPQVTGAGPFAARPHFHAIGHPSTILSITLPQSSSIYISQSSILAANVELNTIEKETALLYGVPYQQLKATEASNLLIHEQSHYRVLDAAKQWTVFDSRRIIGWTGSDVEFSGKLSAFSASGDYNSVKISGKGHIVLDDASSTIFNLQIEPNNEILINPNALIAINTGAMPHLKPQVLTPGTYELHKLDLPHFDWPRWIVNPIKQAQASISGFWNQLNPRRVLDPIGSYWEPIKRQFSKMWHWVYVKINGRLIRRNPIYFKVTGPAEILIENQQMVANNKMFSSEEITKLFKQN